jgi:O-antigen/teichoic acid export membrane protein
LGLLRKLLGFVPPQLLGPGLTSLIIKFSGAIFTYAMVVAFAHMMTAEEYGRFGFGMNLAIIASTIGGFGFATGILRYWPKYNVSHDYAGAFGAVRLGYIACGIGGLIVFFSCLLGSAFFAKHDVAQFAAIGALGLVVGLGDYSTNLLRAQGSVVVSMLPRDVLWRLFSIFVVGFIFWRGGVISGPLALNVCMAVLAVLTLWQVLTVRKRLKAVVGSALPRNDWPEIRKSLLPLWASGVVFAMIQQFDVVIIGSLLSNAEAGAYFAAQKTAMLLSLVLIAAGLIAAPLMSSLYHSARYDDLQRLCRNLATAIAVVTAVGFTVLVLIGKSLLGLFDPLFVSAYPILLIIALGTMIDAVSGPTAYLMQMTSYEKPYLRIMIVCYALVLFAQFLLVPRYGSIGAALASTGGIILWNVWAIALLRKKAGLDPSLLSLISAPQKRG